MRPSLLPPALESHSSICMIARGPRDAGPLFRGRFGHMDLNFLPSWLERLVGPDRRPWTCGSATKRGSYVVTLTVSCPVGQHCSVAQARAYGLFTPFRRAPHPPRRAGRTLDRG